VGCGALQPPPPNINPWDLFRLEKRFHLDLTQVEEAYRKLARQLHPDRFAGKAAVERRMSLQWTALLNESRRILRDPVRRARYLASGRAEMSETGPRLDPEFLQEMFMLREEEEENPGSTRPKAEEMQTALWAELDQLFTRWEANQGDLILVEDRLARLKYVTGLLN